MMCGRDVTGVTADALARAGVCLIPEGRGIFPNLTVIENLRMATDNLNDLTEEVKERPWSLVRIKQPKDRQVPK